MSGRWLRCPVSGRRRGRHRTPPAPRRPAPRLVAFAISAAALLVAGSAVYSAPAWGTDPPGAGHPLSVERVSGGRGGMYVVPTGIHKIRHVIIVMQENRSFDNYFGTYPGVDGIPMSNGTPTACAPDPKNGGCVKPFHNPADIDGGGPHAHANAVADVNGGTMDGFVHQREASLKNCANVADPACSTTTSEPDVMGYHDQREIPNYWTYAANFALDDHMFEPVSSWSLPDHLFLVSGWSARCTDRSPSSCANDIVGPYGVNQFDSAVEQELTTGQTTIDLAWTDITWLLHAHHVSWAYYVQAGSQPDCGNDADETCAPVHQSYKTLGIWNPLPLFGDVQHDDQLKNIKPLTAYFRSAQSGTLPAVTWITPSQADSEHPPASVHQGQAYVTAIINAAMQSPDWSSTAIFLSWDDWGGFYDNVPPPSVDQNGYGLRVPSIVISAYAKSGSIDHQTLSSDAYLKFIEDDFLGGARLNPETDRRPDPRPDVRENVPILGNLVQDFNFDQPPRPPVLLPTNPPTDSPSIPTYFTGKPACIGCTATPPSGRTPIGQ